VPKKLQPSASTNRGQDSHIAGQKLCRIRCVVGILHSSCPYGSEAHANASGHPLHILLIAGVVVVCVVAVLVVKVLVIVGMVVVSVVVVLLVVVTVVVVDEVFVVTVVVDDTHVPHKTGHVLWI
jgi:hypothetical protein